METLLNIPFNLDVSELCGQIHIHPESEDAAEFEQLTRLAMRSGKPKALYTEAYIENSGKDSVSIDGILFTSTMLRDNLAGIDRVFPFVVTCGRELDQVFEADGNILKQFWWDAIKTSLLMSAAHYFLRVLEYKYQLKKIASMSPGSGDVNVWPIEQQRQLFSLLGDVRGIIGVELTDSFLMIPNKTISGIYFPTERDFRTCQVCHRVNCPNRSAPFDQELWDSIHSEAYAHPESNN
jgi:hypothetical protein